MVYVDNYKAALGRMKMCHMVADTTEELLTMADKIGVARKWIQDDGTRKEHFDICLSKRKKAIEHGAKEITSRELIKLLKNMPNRTTEPQTGASPRTLNQGDEAGNQNPSQLKEATILSAEEVLKKTIIKKTGYEEDKCFRYLWMLFDPQPAMNIIVAAMEEYKNQFK